ncbi:MAG TPA: RES domain-containing protein [Candidatus Limnocylindrales bacterium]|jgi:hypothetical protein
MIVYRNTDTDVPFFWEDDRQPEGRWHGAGEGPAQYTATSPDAAWAEFLRHQGITDPTDLPGIDRAMWAIEISDDEPAERPEVPDAVATGALDSYPACQAAAQDGRAGGMTRLVAPSSAVLVDSPSGWETDNGLMPGFPRSEFTVVLFGRRPGVTAWQAAAAGRPAASLLARVRYLAGAGIR